MCGVYACLCVTMYGVYVSVPAHVGCVCMHACVCDLACLCVGYVQDVI